MPSSQDKIKDVKAAAAEVRRVQSEGGKVVFTNGCFDLLHAGHVDLLERARALGDFLVLGLNSDQSVRSLEKGPERPVVPQELRARVMAGLASVDAVVIFNESTPAELIAQIAPDVLVKGGDWPEEKIVGADTVKARGGQVHSLPLVPGLSTSGLVERLKKGRP
ncbi:MAG: D-glycero-beta-D-manno-heptose 1-phosphate adenylyltransferase [Desulfarculaceae bacterium]|nr:D-glycero-beta-D-manno-heptose 1-phosphate adenylyltransferase [Desulfarculaceae bacterium]MCF8071087.1 D-glycero-beta-D-manno-heptose 1-phosphate adenylyltransferase [Desulfarculaceae bacterium]MCF8100675.1 D-glycero-beta-D-manno-heptose 1-phosphate adenylyltransferase [Desulfarculaceae bacterium]MCF8118073.1 D-glycero-beta-D-manno-heptose 1-phosphate adenylyltransferase [Desulfarculaceae bacterium]